MKGLRPRSKIMTLGATPDPIEVSTSDQLFGGRSVEGALTGNPATGDAMLKFSMLAGVAAMIETMLLEQAPQAYAQMMAGAANAANRSARSKNGIERLTQSRIAERLG